MGVFWGYHHLRKHPYTASDIQVYILYYIHRDCSSSSGRSCYWKHHLLFRTRYRRFTYFGRWPSSWRFNIYSYLFYVLLVEFQPSWKICDRQIGWKSSPIFGVNIKNSWVATTQLFYVLLVAGPISCDKLYQMKVTSFASAGWNWRPKSGLI